MAKGNFPLPSFYMDRQNTSDINTIELTRKSMKPTPK